VLNIRKIGRGVGLIIEGCGTLVAAAGLVLLYVSLLARIKFGEWPANSVRILLDNMHSQWSDADWMTKLQNAAQVFPATILDAPLWTFFLMVGGTIYFCGRMFGKAIPITEHT
jgi:hypothetical protein